MDELLEKIETSGFTRRQFAIRIGASRETFRRGINAESEMDVEFFTAINFLYENPEDKRKLQLSIF